MSIETKTEEIIEINQNTNKLTAQTRELYETNYNLLYEFVPELMDNNRSNMWLKPLRITTFDPQFIRQSNDENIVYISTISASFNKNPESDITLYPRFKVKYDHKQKIAKVLEYNISTAARNDVASCSFCENANEDTEYSISVNEYLKNWLSTFIISKRISPNFLVKNAMW